jgi:hypothetical protein
MNNKLFTHLITHLNSFLSKNKNSDEKMVINIQKISEFIKNNQFSDDIFENILLNGIPNNLHCLRPLIWKSFIGYLPPNDLSKWLTIVKNNYAFYKLVKKKYNYYPDKIESPEDKKIDTQLLKDLPRTRPTVQFFRNSANLKQNSEEKKLRRYKTHFIFFRERTLDWVHPRHE